MTGFLNIFKHEDVVLEVRAMAMPSIGACKHANNNVSPFEILFKNCIIH